MSVFNFNGTVADYSTTSLIDAVVRSAKTVIINSGGGVSQYGLAAYDIMVQKNIKTVVVGSCCSSATLILLAGTERLMTENSYILFHPNVMVTNYKWWKRWTTKRQEVAAWNVEAKRVQQVCLKILVERTGMSQEQAEELMSKESILDAKQAIELGVIHRLATPEDFVDTNVVPDQDYEEEAA